LFISACNPICLLSMSNLTCLTIWDSLCLVSTVCKLSTLYTILHWKCSHVRIQVNLKTNSLIYVCLFLKCFLVMWTNSWQFVLILRYADECCTGRKFNSYFTSISQMPANCQTLVSIVVETIPVLSLSLSVCLSHLLPTLPSPFPWQFVVYLMRSYWCLVLCVVEVISHCYMVDMVTCCLIIRYLS